MNVSKKGVRDTFGVPGTGISYQTKRVQGNGCMVLLFFLVGGGLPLSLFAVRLLLG